MATTWDPAQYERYKAYRDRPALDLLVQIPTDLRPREIWDIGCGTGEHAALLKRRHPDARVFGLDQSPEMLERAQARREEVDWLLGDVANWRPERPVDLIFSNAALQWVGDHEHLFPRLASALAPGGVFACQMPLSVHEPWHAFLREIAKIGPWSARLDGTEGVRGVARASDYYSWLSPLGEADIWTTTYLHALEGEDPIVDWMKGSGLRPYLDRLAGTEDLDGFLSAYRDRLRAAYPPREDGVTLLPFPRLFLLFRRG